MEEKVKIDRNGERGCREREKGLVEGEENKEGEKLRGIK